jgi:uncharacterized protein YukE
LLIYPVSRAVNRFLVFDFLEINNGGFMARKKRTSTISGKAKTRLAGLKSIDPALDLGNGMTVAAFEGVINQTDDSVDDYNTTLSSLDNKLNTIKSNESTLADWYERMLTGVATRFGKDSTEYEMAGGTRKSERKKAKKPNNPPTP